MKQHPPAHPSIRRAARQRRKGGGPALAGELLSALLAALGGRPERARLSLLWQNWEQVMGPELAPLALPLGHHKNMLLLGVEDAMLMQELHLMSGEILERVNAFMEKPFFSSVKVRLVLGKNVLNAAASACRTEKMSPAEQSPPPARPRPCPAQRLLSGGHGPGLARDPLLRTLRGQTDRRRVPGPVP